MSREYIKRASSSISFPLLRKISPSLSPIRGLQKLDTKRWHAVDSDPQFEIRSRLFALLSGWISIDIELVSDRVLMPKLYFDFGEGYSESRVIYLRQIDEYRYKAEANLPSVPKYIRFDPSEESCIFEISLFQIKAHSKPLHIMRQFVSIFKHDYRSSSDRFRIFKKSYARYRKHGLEGMVERLKREYLKLYPCRVQPTTSKYINYLNWININESSIEYIPNGFGYTPLISVVMTTHNTPIEYLKKAISSVIDQSYSKWELVICDDASSDRRVVQILQEYSYRYDNISIHLRETNGSVSVASQDALSLARGEFVALLDHDDMLAPNALYEVAKVIDRDQNVKFIYTDEDKIDEKGKRYDPHFKPDWNEDMFLSQNYISHLSVIKMSFLEEIGGFRVGYEGAQDYDLYLRVLDMLDASEIVHIEKILYHWRAIEGSTALDPNAKSYATKAGISALRDYFLNRGERVEVVEGMLPNTYRVLYPVVDEPLVSIIIPSKDALDILSKCIDSIYTKTTYKNFEIIVVDNQTTDSKALEYLEYLTIKYQNIRVVEYNKPFNYAALNNFGVGYSKGELILLLNNDTEIISVDWLSSMVEHSLRPQIGAVGAKLYYPDDTIQHGGVILGIGGVAGHSHKYLHRREHGYFGRLKIVQNLSSVTSACLLVKKSIYLEVGGMDEEYLKVAFNDVDMCLKIQDRGYRNLWIPHAELYHHESISRGHEDSKEKRERFLKEVKFMQDSWGEILSRDPYYNSNLTQTYEDFSIKVDG